MVMVPIPDSVSNPYANSNRTLIVSGAGEVLHPELVRMPFDPGSIALSTTGSGGAANVSYTSALVGSNPDGSDSGIAVSLPVIAIGSPPFNSARIFVPFYGSTFGARFRLDAGLTATTFTVVVDGEAVGVDCSWPPGPYPTLSGFNVVNNEAQAITHRNLPTTGMHMAEIIVNGPTTGATTAIIFHGVLLDRSAGYKEPAPLGAVSTGIVLTTTLVEIDTSRTNGQQAARGIRKVYYINTSGSPVIVDIAYNSVSFKRLYLAATGTAGDSAEWDPGTLVSPTVASAAFTLLRHKASAGSAVTAFTQYGY